MILDKRSLFFFFAIFVQARKKETKKISRNYLFSNQEYLLRVSSFFQTIVVESYAYLSCYFLGYFYFILFSKKKHTGLGQGRPFFLIYMGAE